jgi:hypothetical protein
MMMMGHVSCYMCIEDNKGGLPPYVLNEQATHNGHTKKKRG